MKILWLCNSPIPEIARAIGRDADATGTWIESAYNNLKNRNEIELVICFPQNTSEKGIKGKVGSVTYYGFFENSEPHIYHQDQEKAFLEIVKQENPALVHIFGTESSHSLAMAKVCSGKIKIAVNIQGLCSIICLHYEAGIPRRVVNSFTIRDLLRNDNIRRQRIKFEKRGENEKKTLKLADYVIGRTEWDKACTNQINEKAKYYHCSETMRESFYGKEWVRERTEKHSIFICQSNYPVKGFHFALMAMPEIIKHFPDARLYTTGQDFRKISWYRKNSYQKYICGLMKTLKLDEHVEFLGFLTEQEMSERLLKTGVYVLSSTIENESNSMGEAMIMGVPCVVSDVGGVNSRLAHNEDGYMYPYDESYMLSHYVCKTFEDTETTDRMRKNAMEKSRKVYDRTTNAERLIQIYREIVLERGEL